MVSAAGLEPATHAPKIKQHSLSDWLIRAGSASFYSVFDSVRTVLDPNWTRVLKVHPDEVNECSVM